MKILIIQIVNKYLIKLKNTMTHKYTTLIMNVKHVFMNNITSNEKCNLIFLSMTDFT